MEDLKTLEKGHATSCQDLLAHLLSDAPGQSNALVDPRTGTGDDENRGEHKDKKQVQKLLSQASQPLIPKPN